MVNGLPLYKALHSIASRSPIHPPTAVPTMPGDVSLSLHLSGGSGRGAAGHEGRAEEPGEGDAQPAPQAADGGEPMMIQYQSKMRNDNIKLLPGLTLAFKNVCMSLYV